MSDENPDEKRKPAPVDPFDVEYAREELRYAEFAADKEHADTICFVALA